MSGYVPNSVKIGGYVKVNGVKVKVKNYYFTSSDTPYVPNTDKLVLALEGGVKIDAYKTDAYKVKPVRKKKRKNAVH